MISQHILDILYRFDLSWKYTFEKIDEKSLKQEPLDSPGFVGFCELDEDQDGQSEKKDGTMAS